MTSSPGSGASSSITSAQSRGPVRVVVGPHVAGPARARRPGGTAATSATAGRPPPARGSACRRPASRARGRRRSAAAGPAIVARASGTSSGAPARTKSFCMSTTMQRRRRRAARPAARSAASEGCAAVGHGRGSVRRPERVTAYDARHPDADRPRATDAAPRDVDELEERLSRPTPEVVADLATVDGDIMLLGVGRQDGPDARADGTRAAPEPTRSTPSRASATRPSPTALAAPRRRDHPLPTCSTATRSPRLPRVPNVDPDGRPQVRHHATRRRAPGRRTPSCPGSSPRRWPESRIVAFSTGNVYPFVPVASGGATEETRSCRRPATTQRAASAASACCAGTRRRCGTPGADLPPQLRDRPALRRAARRRPQGARRRAGRRDHGPRQRHLAGRRERDRRCAASRHCTTPTEPLNVTGPGDDLRPRARPRLRRALRHGGDDRRRGGADRARSATRAGRSRAVRRARPCRSRRSSPGRPTGWRAACRPSRSRPASRCGMAPTDACAAPIDGLGAGDLDDALALSAEAGWNQDAARLAAHAPRSARAFAIRDGGRVVATALALPYPPAVGWVSMVLVHGPYRRRGLATRLVERADRRAHRAAASCRCSTRRRPAPRSTAAWASAPIERLTRWRGPGGGRRSAAAAGGHRRRAPRSSTRRRSAPTEAAVLADLARPAARRSRSRRRTAAATCSRAAAGRRPSSARSSRATPHGRRAARGRASHAVPARWWSTCRTARPSAGAALAARGFAPERPFMRMALGRDHAPSATPRSSTRSRARSSARCAGRRSPPTRSRPFAPAP